VQIKGLEFETGRNRCLGVRRPCLFVCCGEKKRKVGAGGSRGVWDCDVRAMAAPRAQPEADCSEDSSQDCSVVSTVPDKYGFFGQEHVPPNHQP